MKSTNLIDKKNRPCGAIVWASAFEFNKDKVTMACFQKPVRGILTYDRYDAIQPPAGRQNAPRYFVPLKKNSDTKLLWSKTVLLNSRDIADTEQEAEELYNQRIQHYIEFFEQSIADLKSMLLD